MGRQTVAGMLLEEELHNQHANLFRPSDIVDTVYDRIPVDDVPTPSRCDIKQYLHSKLKMILRSKRNCWRQYMGFQQADGSWLYRHTSSMEGRHVDQIIESLTKRIQDLECSRDQWDAFKIDMKTQAQQTKKKVYANQVIACLDWMPKSIAPIITLH